MRTKVIGQHFPTRIALALAAMIALGVLFAASANDALAQNGGAAQSTSSLVEGAADFFAQASTAPAPPPAEQQVETTPVTELDRAKMSLRDNVSRRGITYLSGTAALALLMIAFFTFKNVISGQHVVQAIGLIFLVYGTVMLAIIADTDEQLTAAVGILGAIAGYLFGARSTPARDTG